MNRFTRLDQQFLVSLGICAVLALVPIVLRQPYWISVLLGGMFYGTLAQAWNLLAGYTGLFSLAPAAFSMLGAYTSALILIHSDVPILIALLGAVVVSGVVGGIVGWLTLRLKGPYFALTTLAFAEVLRQVVSNSYDLTRGDLGLSVPTFLNGSRIGFYYVFLALLLGTTAGLWLLFRTPAGLFLQAIRDDDVAAAGRGIDIVRWKVIAMILSSAITGIAGALYVHFVQLASPELGIIFVTGIIIVTTFVGGMGTLVGPVIGGLVVQLASEGLGDVGIEYMLVFALVVILLGRFFRSGLWGAVEVLISRLVNRGKRTRTAVAS